jgi:asparagine synthetase B (glutamine-hydrolysing)
MCGFVVSNFNISDSDPSFAPISARGPDQKNVHTENGYTFIHYLLSLTAPSSVQPYASGKVTALFNGEVYNHRQFGAFASEIQCIVQGYESEGRSFFRKLDGEFVIILFDWSRNECVIALDQFGTKPLTILRDGDKFLIASLPCVSSALPCARKVEIAPNSITTISLLDFLIVGREVLTFFDLTQHKNSFDDWCSAFEASVEKRCRVESAQGDLLFIGLSTGYDSGAIAAALVQLKRKFVAFSVYDAKLSEQYSRRSRAITSVADHYLISDRRHDHGSLAGMLLDYRYGIFSLVGDYFEDTSASIDSGGRGLRLVCEIAKKFGLKAYLSGSGADEIISDYGISGRRIYGHSNFGGLFPDRLHDIFPWPSIFGSSMKSYLMKEEYIAGSYGIEGRYPFLDTALVQEYFSLSAKLKNSSYKSPVDYYLRLTGFPFERGEKLGF